MLQGDLIMMPLNDVGLGGCEFLTRYMQAGSQRVSATSQPCDVTRSWTGRRSGR